jgi:hypothetical protein
VFESAGTRKPTSRKRKADFTAEGWTEEKERRRLVAEANQKKKVDKLQAALDVVEMAQKGRTVL